MRGFVRALIVTALLARWPGQASDFAEAAAAAQRAREAGTLTEACGHYREALRVRPDWTDGWWGLGTAYYDLGRYTEAIEAFQKLTHYAPRAGAAWAMLGLSEYQVGRKPEAREHLAKAYKIGIAGEPRLRHAALYTLGLLSLEEGRFAEAQKALEELSRDGLEHDDLCVALGFAVLGILPQKAPAEILDAVRAAGRAQQLGAVRSRLKEALEAYRELAARYPKIRNVHFALGRFLLAHHMDDEALEAFQKELHNSSNHLLARLGIAAILLRKAPAEGVPYAEEAVRMAPQLAESHYLLGALLLETGQTLRAIEELETARSLDGRDARIHFTLARAYARAGRKEDAERARAAFQRYSDESSSQP
ncbi:MAG TPA: tetratricopeptide repeat protein [Bryobacteraceae bacterium]|nr:tetratricopeptide repeat protein [Bryobacteraceae bacterium]